MTGPHPEGQGQRPRAGHIHKAADKIDRAPADCLDQEAREPEAHRGREGGDSADGGEHAPADGVGRAALVDAAESDKREGVAASEQQVKQRDERKPRGRADGGDKDAKHQHADHGRGGFAVLADDPGGDQCADKPLLPRRRS